MSYSVYFYLFTSEDRGLTLVFTAHELWSHVCCTFVFALQDWELLLQDGRGWQTYVQAVLPGGGATCPGGPLSPPVHQRHQPLTVSTAVQGGLLSTLFKIVREGNQKKCLIVFSVFCCAGWGRVVRTGRTLWVTSVAGRPFSTSSQRSTSPSGQTMTSVRHGLTSSAESPASTGLVCCSVAESDPWGRVDNFHATVGVTTEKHLCQITVGLWFLSRWRMQ